MTKDQVLTCNKSELLEIMDDENPTVFNDDTIKEVHPGDLYYAIFEDTFFLVEEALEKGDRPLLATVSYVMNASAGDMWLEGRLWNIFTEHDPAGRGERGYNFLLNVNGKEKANSERCVNCRSNSISWVAMALKCDSCGTILLGGA